MCMQELRSILFIVGTQSYQLYGSVLDIYRTCTVWPLLTSPFMFSVGNCWKTNYQQWHNNNVFDLDPHHTKIQSEHIQQVSTSTSLYTCKLPLWRRLELCLSLKRRNSINSEEVCFFSWCFLSRYYTMQSSCLLLLKTTSERAKANTDECWVSMLQYTTTIKTHIVRIILDVLATFLASDLLTGAVFVNILQMH